VADRSTLPLAMPQIQITLDSMRQTFVQALIHAHVNIEEEVDKALKAAVESFDFDLYVQNETHAILRDSIKEALKRAFGQAFSGYKSPLQEALNAAVVGVLREHFKKDKPDAPQP
jgi:hypothetical protein